MNGEDGLGKASSIPAAVLDAKTVERNTNKEYLLDQFNYATRTADTFLQKHPELNLLTSFLQERRDAEARKYSRPDLEVYLCQENVVNIAMLMKSIDMILSGEEKACFSITLLGADNFSFIIGFKF